MQTLLLSHIPGAQVSVHVSMVSVEPMVFAVVDVAAHAETRESIALVHVYVAASSAPATTVQVVQVSAVSAQESEVK